MEVQKIAGVAAVQPQQGPEPVQARTQSQTGDSAIPEKPRITPAVVYTSRQVLRSREESAQDNLRLSVQISRSLTSVVKNLAVRPSFLVAKGGITSYDVGIRGLGVRRA